VAETINLTDAPSQPITDFIPWNELDLQDERGDHEDDWSNLDRRYALIGGWAYSVVQMLRQWSPQTRIHFPAWTPDHGSLDHLDRMAAGRRASDVVDFHAYDSLAKIQRLYGAMRQTFPAKPLALTEWHCKGDLQEEERSSNGSPRRWQDDPLFDAAYFFIWRWWDHPGWWDDAWDIEHDPARLDLFKNPPTAQTRTGADTRAATHRRARSPVQLRGAMADHPGRRRRVWLRCSGARRHHPSGKRLAELARPPRRHRTRLARPRRWRLAARLRALVGTLHRARTIG
jgi:hypothetical protein